MEHSVEHRSTSAFWRWSLEAWSAEVVVVAVVAVVAVVSAAETAAELRVPRGKLQNSAARARYTISLMGMLSVL